MMVAAYMRRKRFEADLQAVAIWKLLGDVMNSKKEPADVPADVMMGKLTQGL